MTVTYVARWRYVAAEDKFVFDGWVADTVQFPGHSRPVKLR